MTKLSVDEQAEYSADVVESNRRYDKAYGKVLDHTSLAEQTAFWKPFSGNDDELRESLDELRALSGLGVGTRLSEPADSPSDSVNPMATGTTQSAFSMSNPMSQSNPLHSAPVVSSKGKEKAGGQWRSASSAPADGPRAQA